MSITADKIVELFERDVRARKRFAELLVVEPDLRLLIINAVLRDVATRRDIEELRKEMKRDIAELKRSLEVKIEREIDRLEREIDRLFKLVIVSVLGILASIITTILVRILLP